MQTVPSSQADLISSLYLKIEEQTRKMKQYEERLQAQEKQLHKVVGKRTSKDLQQKILWLESELASTDKLLHKRTAILNKLEVRAESLEEKLKAAEELLEAKNHQIEALRCRVDSAEARLAEAQRPRGEDGSQLEGLRHRDATLPLVPFGAQRATGDEIAQLEIKVAEMQEEQLATDRLLAASNTRCRELEIANSKLRHELRQARGSSSAPVAQA